MNVTAKLKKLQLFNDKVIKALDKKTSKALITFGAFTRREAQFSMKSKKGASKPGHPPNAHIKLLKRLILYFFDSVKKSVVVGPVLSDEAESSGMGVPRVLEAGGVVRRVDKFGQMEVFRYEERPYIEPAAQKNLSKVAEMYKDA